MANMQEMRTASSHSEDFSIERQVALNRFFLVCIGFGCAVIAFSLLAQYGWGYTPCRLCQVQRWLHGVLPVFAVAGCLLPFRIFALRLVRLCLLASCAVAAYHFAVQMGWFLDPCLVPQGIGSIESFKRVLLAPPPCSATSWKLLGCPVTVHNFWLSAAVLLLSFRLNLLLPTRKKKTT